MGCITVTTGLNMDIFPSTSLDDTFIRTTSNIIMEIINQSRLSFNKGFNLSHPLAYSFMGN